MVRTGWEVVAVAFRGRIGWSGRNRNSANDVTREANFLLLSQIVICKLRVYNYLFVSVTEEMEDRNNSSLQ